MQVESHVSPGREAAGRLAGKTAIVTGGASGIGLASARRFAAEGANVVIADLDLEAATAAVAGIGERAVPAPVDVRDEAAIKAMVDLAVDRFGTVDVLFNNAGVAEAAKPLEEIGREEWDLVVGVNLTAFFLCAQAVAPVMKAAGKGSIILTASIAARRPRAGLAAYVAAKSGAIGLAKELALELAPDIRVNTINPGPAQTPMLEEFGFAADSEQALTSLGQALPLGRAIAPEDIAAAAVYLASEESRMVTGITLNVDAGRDL